MKRSLRTTLTFSIAAVAMVLMIIISTLSSYFINQQFKDYVSKQQQSLIHEIVNSIGLQYDPNTKIWNDDNVHAIGMNALYDGYIIKVYDENGKTIWDAEIWDMSTCIQIKEDITHSMLSRFPESDGKFIDTDYALELSSTQIGKVNVTYFGPYFYTDNDFYFLNQMKLILLIIGMISLLISIVLGYLISRRISTPILRTIKVTQQISEGDYKIRIPEQSKLTEVDQLIDSVNALASSLDKQEILKKKLTADVAHELRTPLTTLRIALEAMMYGVLETTQDRLKSSYDEVMRISNIVKDLESLALVEDGNLKLDKEETSLVDVAYQAIEKLEFQIKEKKMQVTVSGSCDKIMLDPARMIQVILNLLTNAIKYTPEGGEIKLEIEKTKDEVILKVIDNGSGISKEDLPHIFERFFRADKSRNRSTGGSGIGLTIVKSIVSAHGGNVEVQSELDKGSLFTIRLPK